jgi:hypothetical protein
MPGDAASRGNAVIGTDAASGGLLPFAGMSLLWN